MGPRCGDIVNKGVQDRSWVPDDKNGLNGMVLDEIQERVAVANMGGEEFTGSQPGKSAIDRPFRNVVQMVDPDRVAKGQQWNFADGEPVTPVDVPCPLHAAQRQKSG